MMADAETMNDTDSCTTFGSTPSSWEYFPNLKPVYLIFTIICAGAVLTTTGIFINEIIVVFKHCKTWLQPMKTIWLLGLYPMMGWTAMIWLLMPRTRVLNELLLQCYLSGSVYVFRQLMVGYYGDISRMLNIQRGLYYMLDSIPCCCCCHCLPRILVSKRSLFWVDLTLIQYIVIMPVISIGHFVVMAGTQTENSEEHTFEYVQFVVTGCCTIVNTISSFVALYGLIVFYQVSIHHLSHTAIEAKFICLNLVIFLHCTLTFGLWVMSETGMFPCATDLNRSNSAKRIGQFMLVTVSFLISVITVFFYKEDLNLDAHLDDLCSLSGSDVETLDISTSMSYIDDEISENRDLGTISDLDRF